MISAMAAPSFMTVSPWMAGRFGPAELLTVGAGFYRAVKRARRVGTEVLICVLPLERPGMRCRPNYRAIQLSPVKNLTFSGEVQWLHLDQKMPGSSVFAATRSEAVARGAGGNYLASPRRREHRGHQAEICAS